MNRRPRRLQRQAPPLRGRAATLPSLINQTHFAPLSARPITRQPPVRGGLRPGRRLDQPYSSVQSYPKVHDTSCQAPAESPQALKLLWVGWIKRWGWFVAMALAIMAIAIGLQR